MRHPSNIAFWALIVFAAWAYGWKAGVLVTLIEALRDFQKAEDA